MSEQKLRTVSLVATVDGEVMGQIVKSDVPENCIPDVVISLSNRMADMIVAAEKTEVIERSELDLEGATTENKNSGDVSKPRIVSPNSIEGRLTTP